MTTTEHTTTLLGQDGDLVPMAPFLAFHAALRRDASRFTNAARRHAAGWEVSAHESFAEHWRTYRDLLVFHHQVEDERMFRMVRQADPALGGVIDELTTQHHDLHDLLGRSYRLGLRYKF